MAKCKATNEKQRPRVCGVSHVGIEARRNQAMRRMHREVEREERAENAEAVQADVRAERDSQYAEEE